MRRWASPRLVTYNPAEALVQAVVETGHIIQAARASSCSASSWDARTGASSGGPVRIAEMSGQAASLGFVWLVQLVAILSVGIGIL